jgi:small subunit ribosomal protein S16|tara:strand:- start:200 stop:496 length:297 start_codon:yes stop_codon:yes gene_type:complete
MVANGHLNGFFVMAVKLRLKRVGARNTPAYRIVATDGRNRRDGRPKEELGTYEPLSKKEPNYSINLERAEYWLSVGAQPSDTVRSFIRKARRASKADA